MKPKAEIPTRAEAAAVAIMRGETALAENADAIAKATRNRDDAVSAEIRAETEKDRGAAREAAAGWSRELTDLQARRGALELALERAMRDRDEALGQASADVREQELVKRRDQALRLHVHALEIDALVTRLGEEYRDFAKLAVELDEDSALRPTIPNFPYAMGDARPLVQARLGHYRLLVNRSTDDPTKPPPSLADRIKGVLQPLLPESRK